VTIGLVDDEAIGNAGLIPCHVITAIELGET